MIDFIKNNFFLNFKKKNDFKKWWWILTTLSFTQEDFILLNKNQIMLFGQSVSGLTDVNST